MEVRRKRDAGSATGAARHSDNPNTGESTSGFRNIESIRTTESRKRIQVRVLNLALRGEWSQDAELAGRVR